MKNRMKRIKLILYFCKSFIDIFDRAFQLKLLFAYKVGHQKFVRFLIFTVLMVEEGVDSI